MEKFEVITIGSSTRDVFIKVKAGDFKVREDQDFITGKALCYPFGSKVEVTELKLAPGGGGINSATTFARQGFRVSGVGIVSDDSIGRDLIEFLKAEGIDTSFFVIHEHGGEDMTAYSTILVNEDGERSILSYKGEGQHFDVSEINWDGMDAEWFYVDSLGGKFELFQKIIETAREKGIKVAINPGSKELAFGIEKMKPYLNNINIFATNQEEASVLTGIDYKNEKEVFKMMDDLIDGVYVMTKGPQGAVVSDGKKVYRTGPAQGGSIERTGAGDAFNSAFTAGYIRFDGNIEEALELAMANSQSVVSHFGAVEGILRQGEKGNVPIPKIEIEDL